MRERASAIGAALTVISSPGEGAQIEVSWHGCARVRDEV
jgi:signal transduction histidine kinase